MIRLFADREATRRLQAVGLWLGLTAAYVTIQPEPVELPTDDGLKISHLDVSVQALEGEHANGPGEPDVPILVPERFAVTRTGQWALLAATLPAKTPLFVDFWSVGTVAYVGGDDAVRQQARAIGELARAAGVRFEVRRFDERPRGASFPVLQERELQAALTANISAGGLRALAADLLPEITGVQFRVPTIPHVRVHVATTASNADVARVKRVFPEISTPGFQVDVVRDGGTIWKFS